MVCGNLMGSGLLLEWTIEVVKKKIIAAKNSGKF